MVHPAVFGSRLDKQTHPLPSVLVGVYPCLQPPNLLLPEFFSKLLFDSRQFATKFSDAALNGCIRQQS